MPVTPMIPEDELRAALRPHRPDPFAFEAGVRHRLEAAAGGGAGGPGHPPAREIPPLLKGAAALLPMQVLAGAQAAGGAAAKLAPAGLASKLIGYLAFPAIGLFVLCGAAAYSVGQVRRGRPEGDIAFADERERQEATRRWWQSNHRPVYFMAGSSFFLVLSGATWLLFLLYTLSFGLMLWAIADLGKLGLGHRREVGRTCATQLMLFAQIAGIGDRDIHFLDQGLVPATFLAGCFLLFAYTAATEPASEISRERERLRRWGRICLIAVLIGPLSAWHLRSALWPTTPSRIKGYVESFRKAPYSSDSWRHWGIPARWTIESGLDPDLSEPRRLLAEEIAGEQNSFVLGQAFRAGLVRPDQVAHLKDYARERRQLLDQPAYLPGPQPILSLEQNEWVIRASILSDNLSPAERTFLEQRLLATLASSREDTYKALEDLLLTTQLLEVIGHPIDRDHHRAMVRDRLRDLQDTAGGWYRTAGGFMSSPKIGSGSLDTTSDAIELMGIYGIPDGIDFNRLRSYLHWERSQITDGKWTAAVALDRLDRLPGVPRPTWIEFLHHERNLVAAIVIVALSFFATFASPRPGPPARVKP